MIVGEGLQRQLAIRRRLHLEPLQFQEAFEHFSRIAVVFDDEYRRH